MTAHWLPQQQTFHIHGESSQPLAGPGPRAGAACEPGAATLRMSGLSYFGWLCFIFVRKQKLGSCGEGGDGERLPRSCVQDEGAGHLSVPARLC